MLQLRNLKRVACRVDPASFVVSTDSTCDWSKSRSRAALMREREKANAKLDLCK